MSQVLPSKAVLVVSLLLDRPMCLDCISAKTGLSTIEADRSLTVIGVSLELLRTDEQCRNCGISGAVYSLHRSVN